MTDHAPERADQLANILNAREAARSSGIEYDTMLGLIKGGVIPHRKIGPQYLITRDDLEAFLADRDSE